MNSKKISVRDLCYIGIFTAIIAACAQISIPMPAGVPMTLQTFAIPLAGVILGTKRGTYSALAYVLLGAIGVPVFANFTGGLGIVIGVTGGFILSFPFMALAAGFGASKNNKLCLWVGLVVGAVVNYICGMFYFVVAMPSNWATAFTACVLPFLPTAVVKIVLVALLGKRIKNSLIKSGVLV